MTWLLWRQHRLQGAVAAALFAVLAVALLLTGWHMADVYQTALRTCRANGTCGELELFQGYGAIVDTVNLTVAVPLIIGVFWGVTSIGRELDQGTHTLVWTQSVSKRSWLTGKLTLLFAATLIGSAAVAGIVTWWSGTPNSLYSNRFDPGTFDRQGVVPVAYALFAAALGLAAGAVLRRTLPAIGVTVLGFVGLRLVVGNFIRPHYMSQRVASVPLDQPLPVSGSYWTVHKDLMLNGRVISGAVKIPDQCQAAADRGSIRQCLGDAGYRYVVHYQPASRFWTFQWIESVGFVLLAAVLVAVAIMTVRRRDA